MAEADGLEAIQEKLRECITFLRRHRIFVELRTDRGYEVAFDHLALLRDPDAFSAAINGVTKELYLQYCSLDWQCEATTKRGERCKNAVASVYGRGDNNLTPEFNHLDVAHHYCVVHLGGE